MLQAINANKAGRNISSSEMHWRKLFKASEDSLTSTIIGLLLYLPLELGWHILTEACYDPGLPQPARILSREFWPLWNSAGTRNSRFVEPDVFIRTPGFDLIIEAKRYDYDQHSALQWQTEFRAYLNEYAEDARPVFLLALGGISSEQTVVLTDGEDRMPIFMCRWERLLKSCRNALAQLNHSRHILQASASAISILEDLLLGFSIHGYMTADWFEDTSFKDLTIRHASLQVLTNLRPLKIYNNYFEDILSASIKPHHISNLDHPWS